MTERIKLPEHIHLYKRIDLVPKWKTKLPETHKHYRPSRFELVCQKPLCTHRIALDLAMGKLCQCWVCDRPFILDKETIQRIKPRCADCIVRKPKSRDVNIAALTEFLNEE